MASLLLVPSSFGSIALRDFGNHQSLRVLEIRPDSEWLAPPLGLEASPLPALCIAYPYCSLKLQQAMKLSAAACVENENVCPLCLTVYFMFNAFLMPSAGFG